ncbi:MAG: UDP-N-acetylglucosamine 2-epimerase (hydrolyzing) [Planctomycetes bacterium]|nr:UDP-N-acetylglucosamine 2-epimerase (hydrolyzing) [Planctomycetota bacterium]
MIGDGWNEEPSVRPDVPAPGEPRRVAVVTGSRAEFGLLRPVMLAVAKRADLTLMCIAAGSHLVGNMRSYYDVKADFNIADIVPMQESGRSGRSADVQSVARGVARFGRAFEKLSPQWVVVLGDRIEAFAAATAASIGGYGLAHVHGGDRAEGVADEAMRHAITKLAHLHLAATPQSAERIVRMGERPSNVHTVGSPAIDAIADIPPLDDGAFAELGSPDAVLLMHPTGRSEEQEEAVAAAALEALAGRRVLALYPNLDPGREGILRAILNSGVANREHLPRGGFVGLLKRLAASRGVLVGNSSAALIEAAALKVAAVDIGSRQAGRERCGNVVSADSERPEAIASAVAAAGRLKLDALTHPYGAGNAGVRIAELLATVNPLEPGFIRKRCAY